MDTVDSYQGPDESIRAGVPNDIFKLMVDETRQSFYQRENFVRSLDAKSFGIVGINAILFTMFSYIRTLISNEWLYVPYGLLIISLIMIALCIYPRKWDRQDSRSTITHYGNLEFRLAATKLAINYATWDGNLKQIYDKKIFWFEYGLLLTIAAFVLEIILAAFSSFQMLHSL